MGLTLLSFRPDFSRLMYLASRERLNPLGEKGEHEAPQPALPPGGDLGYALHAVFRASFDDLAPRPFRLLVPGEPGGGPSGRLFAYSAVPLAELKSRAALFADPAFLNVLALERAEDKPMPTAFAPGTRLGFAVRLRPVQRTGASPDGRTPARERDVYSPGPEGAGAAARADAYRDWLADQFARDGSASLEQAEIVSLKRTKLFVRDRSGAGPGRRALDGPDVGVSGVLRVEDGAAFATLLARGVGRFRAFGFGMLLLRPPG